MMLHHDEAPNSTVPPSRIGIFAPFAGSKSGAVRVGSGEGDLFQTQKFDLRIV